MVSKLLFNLVIIGVILRMDTFSKNQRVGTYCIACAILTLPDIGPKLLELLTYVADGAERYWHVSQGELVQAFLEAQPQAVKEIAEDRLVDGLVDSLPVDAVARSMQRLALFAHLPPIRKELPTRSRPFSRIQQWPNPPPRSARYQPPVAGGVFGPPPEAHRPQLSTQETRAPQAPLPDVSPRTLPKEIERRIAKSRKEP